VKDLFVDDTRNITVERLSDIEVDHYSIPAFDALDGPAREHGASIASNKTLLRGGELLFSKLNSHKPRVWLVPSDAHTKVASTEFIALREWHVGKGSMAFARYLLGSAVFAEYISCFQTAVTNSHKRINPEDLLRTHIPLPPLSEQERITAYLDASCAAIDAAVAAKRRQIETLDLRLRSIYFTAVTRGLDDRDELWDPQHPVLAALPVGWNFVAIKRLVSTKVTDGPHETPELVDDGVQFISAEAIKGGRIDFNYRRGFISPELHAQYSRKCLPQRNDIFIIKSGATTGNVACVDVDFEFSIWSPLALVRCDERKLHYRFAYYVFLTDVFRKQVELSWSFGTQQNIGMRVIERLKVPLPPLAEQHAITLFLDTETATVEQIKATIVAQIDTLIAYRKSLIHECVTGQRRVTEADVNRTQAHG
jgi:type I restriction enzyme S subunit